MAKTDFPVLYDVERNAEKIKSLDRRKERLQMVAGSIQALAKHQWVLFLIVTLVGGFDYLTGPELSSGLFYLIPVALMAWWHSSRSVSIIALFCALIWLLVDLATVRYYTQPMPHYWNGFTRLVFFWGIGFALFRIRQLQLRQMELLNYIVHDMRNPLIAVTGNLESIEANTAKDISPLVQACFKNCHIASKRMMTLIDSIMDLGRLEEGKMPVNIGTLSVRDLVDQAIAETSVYAANKKIQVIAKVVTTADLVRADPNLIHRILVNLITNAIKVSPKESRILVQASKTSKNEIVFAIVDKGPGVPQEYITRVFDKFVQVQLMNTGGLTGSGLGLAFCKMAVSAQKGRIWIENVPDNGASVLIALPSADVP